MVAVPQGALRAGHETLVRTGSGSGVGLVMASLVASPLLLLVLPPEAQLVWGDGGPLLSHVAPEGGTTHIESARSCVSKVTISRVMCQQGHDPPCVMKVTCW